MKLSNDLIFFLVLKGKICQDKRVQWLKKQLLQPIPREILEKKFTATNKQNPSTNKMSLTSTLELISFKLNTENRIILL